MTGAATLKTDKIDEAHILSIIPAPPGWFALWRDNDGETWEPVACWALVQYRWNGDSIRDVVAMTPGDGGGLALAEEAAWRELRYSPRGTP